MTMVTTMAVAMATARWAAALRDMMTTTTTVGDDDDGDDVTRHDDDDDDDGEDNDDGDGATKGCDKLKVKTLQV